MRLGKKVTADDAKVAIGVVKSYLLEVGYDEETKMIDIDKMSGNSASKRNKLVVVRETIMELEKKLGKMLPMEEVEKALKEKLLEPEIEEAIERLLKSGDLFRPKRGFIQKM